MRELIWLGIVFCISQSAIFSGLNLAFFSISKIRLKIEAAQGNKNAINMLEMRKNSNFLLSTILWGNVAVNVLLTLLSHSVMAGIIAFLFSTFFITIIGEIVPQTYFSRNALKMVSLFTPVMKVYQFLLFPIAKPTSLVLDKWFDEESFQYFKEKDIEELLKMHIKSSTDISKVEGKGALNFLAIDDIPVSEEGETVDPKSIIQLSFNNNRPVFPIITFSPSDEFLKQVQSSEKKWVIILDESNEPRMALNSDSLLRDALFKSSNFDPYRYCHRPIIIKSPQAKIREVLPQFKVHPVRSDDDVIDEDLILFWGKEKKVITGSDILGRLLRGIVQ